MLIQILLHTPVWVWLLLAGLLALGLWQRRSRQVSRARLLALPLSMLALGLWSMAPGFVAQPLVAAAWLAALLLATSLGRRLPPPTGAQWRADVQRLWLPGSWLPLVIIVCIFSLRYASGVALALHPEWKSQLNVQLPMALVFGLLSGVFLGRALAQLALTRLPLPPLPLPLRTAAAHAVA